MVPPRPPTLSMKAKKSASRIVITGRNTEAARCAGAPAGRRGPRRASCNFRPTKCIFLTASDQSAGEYLNVCRYGQITKTT